MLECGGRPVGTGCPPYVNHWWARGAHPTSAIGGHGCLPTLDIGGHGVPTLLQPLVGTGCPPYVGHPWVTGWWARGPRTVGWAPRAHHRPRSRRTKNSPTRQDRSAHPCA